MKLEGNAFPGSCFDSTCHKDRDLLWQRRCQALSLCNAMQKHGTYGFLTQYSPGLELTMWKNSITEKWYFFQRTYTRDYVNSYESALNGNSANEPEAEECWIQIIFCRGWASAAHFCSRFFQQWTEMRKKFFADELVFNLDPIADWMPKLPPKMGRDHQKQTNSVAFSKQLGLNEEHVKTLTHFIVGSSF